MCANCKPIGIKLDGDKLVTVYSPGVADTYLYDRPYAYPGPCHFADNDGSLDQDMNYARTRQDQ